MKIRVNDIKKKEVNTKIQQKAEELKEKGMKVVFTDTFKESVKNHFSNEPKYVVKRAWRYVTEDVWDDLKHYHQRGTRGYADSDAWSVDDYLFSFMPELLLHMIDKKKGGGNGWPSDENDPNTDTYEHWHKTVKKIARGFEAARDQDNMWEKNYSIKRRREVWDKLEKERIEGMTLFVKYFHSLWD